MYLAEQYGSKREDLLNSLWLGAPMMQHGLNLQNLQEESYLYQAILSAGEMLKENISNSTHFNKEKIRATILFIEWISINYHSHLNERKFKKAIKRYIYKFLQHSLKNDFSLHDLLRLCNALRKLTLNVSLLVLVHHVGKKIKRQLTRNK